MRRWLHHKLEFLEKMMIDILKRNDFGCKFELSFKYMNIQFKRMTKCEMSGRMLEYFRVMTESFQENQGYAHYKF